jgi:hypothetical protein
MAPLQDDRFAAESRPKCRDALAAGPIPVRVRCSQTAGAPASTHVYRGGSQMAWIKPEFEFVDLCSEVTSYLYHR